MVFSIKKENFEYIKGLKLGKNLLSKAIVTKPSQKKRNYDIHRRTHTGEKPYNCCHCDKAFAKKGALKYTQGLILRRSSFNLSKTNKYRKQCSNLEQSSLSMIQKFVFILIL